MPEVGKIEIKWYGDEVKKEILDNIEDIMETAGKLVKDEAIRAIKFDPKTGKWYWGRSGRYYQASADTGKESPAIDTGSLMRSISVLMEKKKDEVTAYIGTMDESKHDSQYKKGVSVHLEMGHYQRGKPVRPRPFLRPALRKKQKEIIKLFGKGTAGKATF